jgi:hypothetical protein
VTLLDQWMAWNKRNSDDGENVSLPVVAQAMARAASLAGFKLTLVLDDIHRIKLGDLLRPGR